MNRKELNCFIMYSIIFLIIILITYFIFTYDVCLEGLNIRYNCPDKLIKKDNQLRLYSKDKYMDLSSIDDYINIVKLQEENGINCPVLQLNTYTDLSSSEINKSVDEKVTKLLDANRSTDVYNYNQYPGYDPMNLYIGIKTPLDLMNKKEQNKKISANPMNSNWGGNQYTTDLVNAGYYDDNKATNMDTQVII